MSSFNLNKFNTTDLTLHVMANCAFRLDLDIENDRVADALYWVCCDLESWPEDCGFGSSDHFSYVQEARRAFHIPENPPPTRCTHCGEADNSIGAHGINRCVAL